MDFRKSLVLVIAAIIYTFILKFGVTIFPESTSALWAAQMTQILSLLASLTFIIFGIYFIREVIGTKNELLKRILILAFLNPLYIILIKLENIIRISPKLSMWLNDISPGFYAWIMADNYRLLSQIILLLGSIFIFRFFYLLYKNMNRDNVTLVKATHIMVFATALGILIRTAAPLTLILYPDPNQMTSVLWLYQLIGFLVFLMITTASLVFYWRMFNIKEYSEIL